MARSFTPRNSQGVPTPVLPAEDAAYSQADWDEETFALFAEGRDPAACPLCSRTGFYGPRVSEALGNYRECRFCGFFQKAGGPAELATPVRHGCDGWPEIARAPYVWWIPPGRDTWVCGFCKAESTVEETRTAGPYEDDAHPWWKVPQARTRFYYARLWENWPFTKGRVFL